ncbi:trichohyalin-like [Podarcis lilfordi]|uniref:Trichohyalin-like n=1 Tax=Podarcis lilfordi TaxID=74358 RepID=A0AA35LLN7_9SAUR|nr:trichohyalin-like [Podarcis lilfordi]
MSSLLDNIRAIQGIFYKHAQHCDGKVSLCRREMKRLIQEEFAEVIENPCDPQTLELMFQLLDINGDCSVEFNEYLILIFRTATACCCRLESGECGEICREPCERELRGDGKDCHQVRGGERKHVSERRGEPEARTDERSHQACDLELRDGHGRTRPSCKAQEWEDICECRKCGSQRQSKVTCDLEPRKDKATPCHLLGEDGQGRQQYCEMKDMEGESERRMVQLITAELRDEKRKRGHGRERRASEDGQRKPQGCESELLGSQRRCSPVRGRLLRRGRAQYYEPEPLDRDADPRRSRGCEPTRREAASLEGDSDQECDARPREVKRRRSQSCGPELREKIERDQQSCDCEPLGKEGDRRRPQGRGVSLRKDAQKQRCDPESLERDAQKKTSQACTPGLCEDSQWRGEVGGLERGEEVRRSVRREVTRREDILGRQASYETGSLGSNDDDDDDEDEDEERRRPQVCEPGLRECKKQLCREPRALEGERDRRRLQPEVERRREIA